MFLKFAGACALALIVAGCATQSPQSAFMDVQKLSDGRIVWGESNLAVKSLLAEPLTMDSAVHVALLNNPSLQADYESLAISQADLVQAGLLRNPVLGASARFPDRSPGATDFELSVTQSFVDLLSIPSRRRIASDELEATKLRVAHHVIELAADVKAALVAVQASESMLDLQRSSVEAARLAAETAKRLHDAGNISDADLHNFEASFQQASIELTKSEAQNAEQRERLTVLMGAASNDWKVAPNFAVLKSLELDGKSLSRRAIEKRLDAAAARLNINALSKSLGLREQTRWFSEIEIGVDAERQTDRQWIIGPTVSLPIPLFDQGQASVAKLQAQLRAARQKYLALAAQIRGEVRSAIAQLNASRTREQQFRSTLIPLREQIVEESQRQYNGMLLSPFDLLKRKQELLDAQREAIEASRDGWLARIQLERAIGGELEPPMNADERR